MVHIADFLFEIGILAKTPRSGFHFLGSGSQTVGEHLCRTAYVGYALASMDEGADVGLTVMMCLFHDMAEGRTSDLNYVHQKYVHADEKQALKEIMRGLPFEKQMVTILEAYAGRSSKESLLAKDADNIEWLLSLKEQADVGNARATEWMGHAFKRLKTEIGQRVGEQIRSTSSDHWYAEPDSSWWVKRDRNQSKRL